MTIQYWRVFVTVCRYSNITKAAHVLHMAQPAVSRIIKEIEQYYSVTLFERNNKRLSITETGQGVFEYAQNAVRAFDAIEDYILGKKFGHMIRVGASTLIGNYILPRTTEDYRRFFPNTSVKMLIDFSPLIVNHVLADELDFAFVDWPVDHDDIEEMAFPGDRIILLCRKGDPIARTENLTVETLLDQPLYLKPRGNNSRAVFDVELKKHGLTPSPAFENNDANVILDKVLSDGGVAALSFLQVKSRYESENFEQIQIPSFSPRRTFYLINKKDKFLSNSCHAYIDLFFKNAASTIDNM